MVLDIPLLIGYMTAVTLLTITPGVDTALIIQSSLGNTASAAAYAAVGILAGCAAWGLVVAGGLGAVVASSGAVYAALKTIGAGYLVWLGITALRRTVPPTVTPASPRRESIAWVKKGFIANILNPKVGLFYLSLLPQFIPAGASVGRYALLLVALIFCYQQCGSGWCVCWSDALGKTWQTTGCCCGVKKSPACYSLGLASS